MYSLREVIPGWCPVCRQCWSTDPRLECDCTRAQPDDDKQAAAAYRLSAAIREAKLNADALGAARRRTDIGWRTMHFLAASQFCLTSSLRGVQAE